MRTLIDRTTAYSPIFLRLALGIGFLSSVADRFGLWGAAGAKNVAWGNFTNFASTGALLLASQCESAFSIDSLLAKSSANAHEGIQVA